MRRRLLYLLLLLLLVVSAGGCLLWAQWDRVAGIRGDLAARNDIAHGRIRLLWSGLQDREGPEVRRILWEVYGIQAIPAFGCVVGEPQVEYLESYNRRVMTHASERFGQRFYDLVYEEARWNLAEEPRLTEEQRTRQAARYDLALPKLSARDSPIFFPHANWTSSR